MNRGIVLGFELGHFKIQLRGQIRTVPGVQALKALLRTRIQPAAKKENEEGPTEAALLRRLRSGGIGPVINVGCGVGLPGSFEQGVLLGTRSELMARRAAALSRSSDIGIVLG